MAQQLSKPIQSPKDFQSSTPLSPKLNAEKLKLAATNAQKMLRAFPDYGKSPPEYLAAIVNIFAEYSGSVQEKLVNLRYGLPSKCKFLPTVADIVEMAEPLAFAELQTLPKADPPPERYISPEEQARVAKGMAKLVESLKRMKTIEPAPVPRKYDRPLALTDAQKIELSHVKSTMGQT